jgi:hypothetical protein
MPLDTDAFSTAWSRAIELRSIAERTLYDLQKLRRTPDDAACLLELEKDATAIAEITVETVEALDALTGTSK